MIALMTGYINDKRQVTKALATVMRFMKNTNRFETSPEALEADKEAREKGEQTEQRIARICLPAMCLINLDLKMCRFISGWMATNTLFKAKTTKNVIITHTSKSK